MEGAQINSLGALTKPGDDSSFSDKVIVGRTVIFEFSLFSDKLLPVKAFRFSEIISDRNLLDFWVVFFFHGD